MGQTFDLLGNEQLEGVYLLMLRDSRKPENKNLKPIDGICQDLSLTGGFAIRILGEECTLTPTLRVQPSCLSAIMYLRYKRKFYF